jgi:hypothetical protein
VSVNTDPKRRTFGDYVAGAWIFPAVLVAVGAFVLGHPVIGSLAVTAAVLALVYRRLDFDPETGLLTVTLSLLGIPLYRKHRPLEEIKTFTVRPTGTGLRRLWSGRYRGYRVAAVHDGQTIPLFKAGTQDEALKRAKRVATAFPHHVRMDKQAHRSDRAA